MLETARREGWVIQQGMFYVRIDLQCMAGGASRAGAPPVKSAGEGRKTLPSPVGPCARRSQYASAAVPPHTPPIKPTVTPPVATLTMPTAAITMLSLVDDDFAPKRLVRTKRGSGGSRLATRKHATHHQHRRHDKTSGHCERLLSNWPLHPQLPGSVD